MRPGSERFSDWTLDGIIVHEPGEVLVNDDPSDPYRLAGHGKPRPGNPPVTPADGEPPAKAKRRRGRKAKR